MSPSLLLQRSVVGGAGCPIDVSHEYRHIVDLHDDHDQAGPTTVSSNGRSNRRHRDESGTSLIEFTLVASLLFTLLFGIIEFGLAFRDRLTISNASQGAARVGSALGNQDVADMEVLRALQQSLGTLANSTVAVVRYVDVYSANASGQPLSGCPGNRCNRYVYTPGFAPGCDWNPCPNPAAGYSGWGWAPSARDTALPGLDVMGVRITFKHDWVTGGLVPLPNVQCNGSVGSKCWTDKAVMRLEPQVFAP